MIHVCLGPVPVTARSEAYTLIAWTLRSWVRLPLAAVCLSLPSYVVLYCVGSSPASGCSPVQGVLSIVEMIHNFKK
jgi:hypothetical protein